MSYDENVTRSFVRRLPIWAWALAAISGLLILTYIIMHSVFSPAKAGEDATKNIPTVTVLIPGHAQAKHIISATGTLAARVEMPVGANGEGGMISRVLVQPGDWVKRGQILATVERSVQAAQINGVRANIAAAEANAQVAKADYERAKALVSRGFISKADVERKQGAYEAAAAQVHVVQAQLREAQARNGRLDIRAPASGLVLTRNVEPGQVVGGGSGVLFRIAQDGEMELKAQMDETDVAQLPLHAPVEVTPVGASASVSGQVWQISPVIDPQTRQGTARVALHYDKGLRVGGFATAKLQSGVVDAPALPQSAVLSDAKGNYVYIIDNKNRVARRDVSIGDITEQKIIITKGLDGSERVIESAGPFVNIGQVVQPVLDASGH
jgi:RND family efflux transporter MFP subunit